MSALVYCQRLGLNNGFNATGASFVGEPCSATSLRPQSNHSRGNDEAYKGAFCIFQFTYRKSRDGGRDNARCVGILDVRVPSLCCPPQVQ